MKLSSNIKVDQRSNTSVDLPNRQSAAGTGLLVPGCSTGCTGCSSCSCGAVGKKS